MINRVMFNRFGLGQFAFSVAKKPKMELTLRTPYQTYLSNYDGFSRIMTKTNEAALVIQNKSPPAMYVLPPGFLKVKLNQDVKGVSGDFLHMGGWAIIHPDNTCEINVMDLVDRKSIRADEIEKTEIKDVDSVAGKYASKNRKLTNKVFIKKIGSN